MFIKSKKKKKKKHLGCVEICTQCPRSQRETFCPQHCKETSSNSDTIVYHK